MSLLTTKTPKVSALEVFYATKRESTTAFRAEGPSPTEAGLVVLAGAGDRSAEAVIWGPPTMDAAKAAIVASVMAHGSPALPGTPANR